MKTFVCILLLMNFLLAGCSDYTELPADDAVLDGTIDGLSTAQLSQHLSGDVGVNEVFTRETGLGSTFVGTSCIICHAGDGKGHPFTTLTRFGQIDETGNMFLHMGGPQLQNRALPAFLPEQIPSGATFSKFTPPAFSGLGFLQYVTDADIMAMSDPDDLDGDGISGVPNWIRIPDYSTPHPGAITRNGKYIGRFGKKASAYDLLHQTVEAYNQDMGITSIFNPIDHYTHLEIDPEVPTATVNNVVFYLQTLKAPVQRNKDDPQIIEGAQLFAQIDCAKCHKPALQTGYAPIASLSYKTFYPYTDLLLHDLGNGLDDNYTEGSAKTSEWRTAPLWGIGLSQNSQGGRFFLMHDGRAANVEHAIDLHGGEASVSRSKFHNLSAPQKQILLKFINSL